MPGNREDISAGGAFVKLWLKKDALNKGLDEADNDIDKHVETWRRKMNVPVTFDSTASPPVIVAPSLAAPAAPVGPITPASPSPAREAGAGGSADIADSSAKVADFGKLLDKVLPVLDAFVAEMVDLGAAAYTAWSYFPRPMKFILHGFIELTKAVDDFVKSDLGQFLLGCAEAAFKLAYAMMLIIQPITAIVTIANMIPAAAQAAFGVIMSGVRMVTGAIVAIPGLLLAAVEAVPGIVYGLFKQIASATYSLLSTIGGAVVSTVRTALAGMLSVVKSVATAAAKIVINPGKTIVAPLVNIPVAAVTAVADKLRSISDGLSAIAGRVAKVGAIVSATAAAVIVPLTTAAKEFGEVGTEARKMAEEAGLSVRSLRELGYVAKVTGSSQETLAASVKEVDKTLKAAVDGKSKAIKFFTDLGLSVEKMQRASAEDRFLAIGSALNKITDPLERATKAQKIFGDKAEEMLNLFALGEKGIAQYRGEANALGLVFGGVAAQTAKKLTTAFEHLKDATKGLWMTLGQAVAPIITEVTERMVSIIKMATKWAQENQALIASLFRFASLRAVVGTALVAVAGIIGGVATAFGVAASVVAGSAAAIATIGGVIAAVLTPMTALVAAAAGLAIYFGRAIPFARLFHATVETGGRVWGDYAGKVRSAIDSAMATWRQMAAFVTKVMGGINDAIMAGKLELAIDILWTGAKVAWAKGLTAISSLTGGVFGSILDSLASGDWANAADIAWKSIQIVFTQGLSTLETLWSQTTNKIGQLWTGLQGAFDTVMVYLQKTWNTTLEAIATKTLELGKSIHEIMASAAAWDPTGTIQASMDLLRNGLDKLSSVPFAAEPNKVLDTELAGRNVDRRAENRERQTATDTTITADKAKRDAQILQLTRERETLLQAPGGKANEHLAEQQQKLDRLIAEAETAKRDARLKTIDPNKNEAFRLGLSEADKDAKKQGQGGRGQREGNVAVSAANLAGMIQPGRSDRDIQMQLLAEMRAAKRVAEDQLKAAKELLTDKYVKPRPLAFTR